MPTIKAILDDIAQQLEQQGGRHGYQNLVYINGDINAFTQE